VTLILITNAQVMAPTGKDSVGDITADETTPLSQGDESEGALREGQLPSPASTQFSYQNAAASMALYVLVGITEVIGILAIIMVIVWMSHFRGGFAWDGSGKEFNYHPIFMILGMVFLYGNAAIVYRVLRSTTKFYAKLIHMSLQALALIFAVVGLVAVFDFHNAGNIPNMYSLHSWIGLSTVILFCLQFLFGFMAFLLPKFSDDYRAKYLLIHQYFGSAIFIMAIGTCLLGMTEKLFFSIKSTYSKFVAEGVLANVLGLILVIFGGLVMLLLTKREFKRPPDNVEYSAIK